jgi:hypothetical protein
MIGLIDKLIREMGVNGVRRDGTTKEKDKQEG